MKQLLNLKRIIYNVWKQSKKKQKNNQALNIKITQVVMSITLPHLVSLSFTDSIRDFYSFDVLQSFISTAKE